MPRTESLPGRSEHLGRARALLVWVGHSKLKKTAPKYPRRPPRSREKQRGRLIAPRQPSRREKGAAKIEAKVMHSVFFLYVIPLPDVMCRHCMPAMLTTAWGLAATAQCRTSYGLGRRSGLHVLGRRPR